MRLVTFTHNGSTGVGALRATSAGHTLVDLRRVDPGLPTEMIALLEGGAPALARALQALERAPAETDLALTAVTLHPPIPNPSKIVCIGQNYHEHAAESNAAPTEFPIIFAKYPNTLIASGEAIVIPKLTDQVDYEGELAVVIGRQAKHVSTSDALQYVAGYAPFNDVSARDFQMRTSQWTVGKTFDTFGPMGPALVTADEIPDPQNLSLRVTIGDEVLQSSHTSKMIFSVVTLIAYITSVMTLLPGDIIATGTPAGVGGARKPPRWLRPGERVRVEIEGLGALENPIVAEA